MTPYFSLVLTERPLFSSFSLSPKDPYFGGRVRTSPSLPYVSAPPPPRILTDDSSWCRHNREKYTFILISSYTRQQTSKNITTQTNGNLTFLYTVTSHFLWKMSFLKEIAMQRYSKYRWIQVKFATHLGCMMKTYSGGIRGWAWGNSSQSEALPPPPHAGVLSLWRWCRCKAPKAPYFQCCCLPLTPYFCWLSLLLLKDLTFFGEMWALRSLSPKDPLFFAFDCHRKLLFVSISSTNW